VVFDAGAVLLRAAFVQEVAEGSTPFWAGV
jgi:hypothetical protein